MTAVETEDKNIHTYVQNYRYEIKRAWAGVNYGWEKDDKRMACAKRNEANEINVEKMKKWKKAEQKIEESGNIAILM
jgi:ribosomal protein L14E/L6E/L27E